MNKAVNISVTNWSPPEVIHYVQYGTQIPIEFHLDDYDIPTGSSARFYIKKPSGLEVYNEAEIEGNVVTVHPTAQTFAEHGSQKGQLQLITRDKILVSFILQFDIEKNLIEESAIPSTDEFGVLDTLVEAARAAIEESIAATEAANAATEEATASKEAADTAAADANAATAAANAAAAAATASKVAADTAAEEANAATAAANTAAEAAQEAAAAIFDKVPIEKGGTGATDRANAIQNLLKLPDNTAPAEDAPAAWAALGNFTCYYNGTSTVINKPSTFGTLIQIVQLVGSATTLQQIWLRQGYGKIYARGGNSEGWRGDAAIGGADAWYEYITDASVMTIAQGGTGAQTAANARSNLGLGAVATKDTVPIAQGGTGQTTRETGFECEPLNTKYVTLESQYCAYNAYTRMAHIRATVKISGYALSEGSALSVLQVHKDYRPNYTQAISVVSGSGVICNGMLIDKSNTDYPGYIRFKLSEALLASATIYLYINAHYFI